MEGSPKYSLNTSDLKSIGTGLMLAIAGVVLTYSAEVMGQIDFGEYTPIVAAISSVLINAGRKWVADNSAE